MSSTTRLRELPVVTPTRSVAPLAGDQDDAVVRLHAEIFGAGKAERFRRRFQWQYRRNPFLGAGQVSNWVMLRGSDVVGHLGVVPVPIKVGDLTLRASWLCDYMVREGNRQGKAFLRLTKRGSESSELPMGFGMAGNVARIYTKLGWSRQNASPSLVKPLRLRGAYLLWKAGWTRAWQWRERRPPDGTPGEAASPLRGFDDSFDALWSEVRSTFPIAVERTQEYLRWRYAASNGMRAKIVGLEDGGRLLAFAIVEKVRWRGAVAGLISELVVAREDRRAAGRLLASVEQLCRRQKLSLMLTEGFPSAIREA
ncbi:MAG: GNAT family N-acetyltransferase, partial [Candidatus Binatia bacterium]